MGDTYAGRMRPVVGFDLDLTLVDSADGIVTTFAEAVRRLRAPVDPEAMRPLIGVPLETACEDLLPAHLVTPAVRSYRELYSSLGVPRTKLLPGAREAVAAVRAHGGRAVVVSAKIQSAVDAVLDHVGLDVDTAVGGLFGAEKGAALGAQRALAHVGDHPADIVGAHAAKAIAIGVTTGFHDAAALSAAGADVVLPGLLEFPHWLDENVLHARLAVLEERVQAARSLVVAFSGGADSAFLLAASVRALGPDRVLAATAVSP